MLNSIQKFLSSPVFEGHEEKTRIAGLLNLVLLFSIGATSLALPLLIVFTEPINRLPLIILVLSFILVELIAYVFMRRGQVNLASAIFLLSLGIAILSAYAVSAPGSTGAALSLTILVSFTTLLLDARAIFRLIVFIIAFTFTVILAQNNGWITPAFIVSTDPTSIWITNSFTLVFMALGLYLSSVSLKRALDSSLTSRTRLQKSNQELDELRRALEQRVADRTKELQNQTLRLRASAEIARDAASSHNLNELLDRAVTLIQERFELYHTGIFLLDKNNEYAILTASPTPAGKQMIANNYRLRVGEMGIVGRVASTGEPRISLDTDSDTIHINNPLLPKTHSEMALPLKVENRMIGVLDVQSQQQRAFDENDIAIMQILADQLATAIERTRLLQQVEQNLSDLEQAYGQFTRESWKTLGEAGLLSKAGYRFDNVRIQPITEASTLGDKALQSGTILIDNVKDDSTTAHQVAIPIKLRGQTVGVVTANLKDGYDQTAISTLELAIERLALSLESARLYEETRLRADRERTIAQVTSSISSATEFDSILRTTVEEVGKSLGDATEVSIQIISDTDRATN
jgi:GAF domain-containing protein